MIAIAVVIAAGAGCGADTSTGAGGGGSGAAVTSTGTGATSGTGSPSATSSGATGGGTCATDPLKTGLVAQQTGVSVDVDDCPILTLSQKYQEPDPMIMKAIIYVESRFQYDATACDNLPCGTPTGWTTQESYCYGVMQVVPACGPTPGGLGLLANGHPNLTKDMSSADWPNSIFNPQVNIEIGIAGIAGNRAQVKAQFPGCTEDQYTMMAIGNYNSYGSTTSCTSFNTAYTTIVLDAYHQYSAAAGYAEHPY